MMGFISVRRITTGVCAPAHKRWGLGNKYKYNTSTNAKSRFSCAGTTRKVGDGGLRNGEKLEKGALINGIMKREGIVTDVEQKGVIESLVINYLYFVS